MAYVAASTWDFTAPIIGRDVVTEDRALDWGALTAIAHAQTFEGLRAWSRQRSSEGANLASLSSKLTRVWTSVEVGRKEGAHKEKGGAQKSKGGAAPRHDALAKALVQNK